jgi:glutamate/tyrosine decarboxylase-like PLP-dependent enzyme
MASAAAPLTLLLVVMVVTGCADTAGDPGAGDRGMARTGTVAVHVDGAMGGGVTIWRRQ